MRVNEEIQIPERDLPPGRLHRRKEQLVSELSMWDRTARRRRRRLVLILVPAMIAVLVVTGFTTYALTREPTHLETVGCYDRATLDANVAVVSADGRDPTAICMEIWQHGDLAGEAVPRNLAACVLETGAIGVFPSSDASTCETLGLADLPASYAVEGKRFAALRDAIVSRLGEPASGSTRGGPQCVGGDEARAVVRHELDAHGYGDWDVKVAGEPFSTKRPCADVSFDGGEKVILLVAVGPRG
jgi:hypothetical protein